MRCWYVCIYIVCIGVLGGGVAAGFQWSPPGEIQGEFGEPEPVTGKHSLHGILREPRESFFSLHEGELIFSADSDASANTIFPAPVQVTEHPRDFRSLQILLPEGHYTALIDVRRSRWVNPATVLRRTP